jgi:hypothetical protein
MSRHHNPKTVVPVTIVGFVVPVAASAAGGSWAIPQELPKLFLSDGQEKPLFERPATQHTAVSGCPRHPAYRAASTLYAQVSKSASGDPPSLRRTQGRRRETGALASLAPEGRGPRCAWGRVPEYRVIRVQSACPTLRSGQVERKEPPPQPENRSSCYDRRVRCSSRGKRSGRAPHY